MSVAPAPYYLMGEKPALEGLWPPGGLTLAGARISALTRPTRIAGISRGLLESPEKGQSVLRLVLRTGISPESAPPAYRTASAIANSVLSARRKIIPAEIDGDARNRSPRSFLASTSAFRPARNTYISPVSLSR